MKSVIVGMGEVGTALWEVLRPYYPVVDAIKERGGLSPVHYDILHICFGYSEQFSDEVQKYQELFTPDYTVIHSTVPVGTSRSCNALHSPIIGKHPYLKESIQTFTKFIGGDKASGVAECFRRANVRVYLFDKPETTELMKLLDTTFYGLAIEYTKEVKRLANEYEVPFEAWTLWTDDYNKGYQKLGFPEYTRPNLVPILTKTKGHCVVPNCDLFKSEFGELIKKLNADSGNGQ